MNFKRNLQCRCSFEGKNKFKDESYYVVEWAQAAWPMLQELQMPLWESFGANVETDLVEVVE